MSATEMTTVDQGMLNITNVFNSTIAAFALSAAWKIGALDELKRDNELDIVRFARDHGLDVPSTEQLFRALASVEVVRRVDGKVWCGPNFAAAYDTKGFFYWLTRGSYELFVNLPDLMVSKRRVGEYYQRDDRAVSFACQDINAKSFDPYFEAAIDEIGFRPATIVDFGSGSGQRLFKLADKFRSASLLGIDIADKSIAEATGEALARGLGDRVEFVCADVENLEYRDEFESVEVITCFMMGHDLWPREECLHSLNKFRRVFPNARKLILGDTARSTNITDQEIPVFTMAFEFGHAVMGVDLPTIGDWRSVIEESDWVCGRERLIDTPAASFIFELE